MKTLALRVRFQNESALKIAQFLERHPAVDAVNYAGLASHRQHGRAKELFEGFGGVFSFEPKGGVEQAQRVMKRVTLPINAPSLGGVETLITRPLQTSHAGMSGEDRRRLGISDHLIRVSVGIEATEDLIADFEQALSNP
jgi:cystathionine beta-lyase/cystathionine gamma-synthase